MLTVSSRRRVLGLAFTAAQRKDAAGLNQIVFEACLGAGMTSPWTSRIVPVATVSGRRAGRRLAVLVGLAVEGSPLND